MRDCSSIWKEIGGFINNLLIYFVSYEMGKSLQEGLGEVQEMIDISTVLYGLSITIYIFNYSIITIDIGCMKQYHPLGVVGII